MISKASYDAAIDNLRGLLSNIGRSEFRAYGYAKQLREYRVAMKAAPSA